MGGQGALDRAPEHRLPKQCLDGCMDGLGLHRLPSIRQNPDYRVDDPARPAVPGPNRAGSLAWMSHRSASDRNPDLDTHPVEQDSQGSNRVGEHPYKVHVRVSERGPAAAAAPVTRGRALRISSDAERDLLRRFACSGRSDCA
jgi:hypothetical protein